MIDSLIFTAIINPVKKGGFVALSFIVYLYFIIPLRHQSNNQRINTIRNESILTFAICLSIAYLLYYGANIGKDLYATGKQLTSNEEVFEIEDVPVETAVSVNEQGDGFYWRCRTGRTCGSA